MSIPVPSLSIMLLSGAIGWWLTTVPVIPQAIRLPIGFIASAILHSLLFDMSVIFGLSFQACSWASAIFSVFLLIRLYHLFDRPPLRAPSFSLAHSAALGLIYYLSTEFIPHSGRWGRWDARAIWTMHASFLFHADHWRNLFSPAISWTHADYPLMLSSIVAMCWRAMDKETAIVPCVIAYIIFLMSVVILYGALTRVHRLAGITALCLLALTPLYAKIAAYQGADTLTGLFILVTLVLSVLSDTRPYGLVVFLTGWFCGFTGWTKNEGIAFAVIFSGIFLWHHRHKGTANAFFIAGLVLPVVVVSCFKIFLAPSNDIIEGQGMEAASKLLNVARHKTILNFFLKTSLDCYLSLLVIAPVVFVIRFKTWRTYQMAALLLLLGTYYFIFVLTPRNLTWHLETAAERLFIQLLPGFLFVLLNTLFSRNEAL